MTLLVYAAGFLMHWRGQWDTILSGPPGGTAGHLPGGQQRLTVAAVGFKGHRHICGGGASEARAVGVTSAERSTFVADESYRNMDPVK